MEVTGMVRRTGNTTIQYCVESDMQEMRNMCGCRHRWTLIPTTKNLLLTSS